MDSSRTRRKGLARQTSGLAETSRSGRSCRTQVSSRFAVRAGGLAVTAIPRRGRRSPARSRDRHCPLVAPGGLAATTRGQARARTGSAPQRQFHRLGGRDQPRIPAAEERAERGRVGAIVRTCPRRPLCVGKRRAGASPGTARQSGPRRPHHAAPFSSCEPATRFTTSPPGSRHGGAGGRAVTSISRLSGELAHGLAEQVVEVLHGRRYLGHGGRMERRDDDVADRLGALRESGGEKGLVEQDRLALH